MTKLCAGQVAGQVEGQRAKAGLGRMGWSGRKGGGGPGQEGRAGDRARQAATKVDSPAKQVHGPIKDGCLLCQAGTHSSQTADAKAVSLSCEGLLILHWIHKPCIPAPTARLLGILPMTGCQLLQGRFGKSSNLAKLSADPALLPRGPLLRTALHSCSAINCVSEVAADVSKQRCFCAVLS